MKREIIFTQIAGAQIQGLASQNPKLLKKLFELIEDIDKHPFEGLGKPEALKHELQGKWSRRINQEHRLVYTCNDKAITIYSCLFHY